MAQMMLDDSMDETSLIAVADDIPDIVEGEDAGEADLEDTTEAALVDVGCSDLVACAVGASDIGRREGMEDRFTIRNLSTTAGRDGAYIGVFDGHNGAAVADELQRHLHEVVASRLAVHANVTEALKAAFVSFEETCAACSPAASDVSGSTALVAVLQDCQVHIANLGDSRAVAAKYDKLLRSANVCWPEGSHVEVLDAVNADLLGQRAIIEEVRSMKRGLYILRMLRDGSLRPFRQSSLRLLSALRAVRLTIDHKPDLESEVQRIESLGGKVDYPASKSGIARIGGLATSRCFGSNSVRPYVSSVPDVLAYTLDDQWSFIVLATDGVWDVLSDQYVVDLVWDQISVTDARHGPADALRDSARVVVQAAMERGSTDNLSCVVVLLTRGSHLRSQT